MFFDRDIDRVFKAMQSGSFFGMDDGLGEVRENVISGPYYYGYTMTVGPDGKPVVKEYGNIGSVISPLRQQQQRHTRHIGGSDAREPVVDTIVDEKQKIVKLIAEMPGIEKEDVKIVVDSGVVDISAKRGEERRYHAEIPLRHSVDEKSAKASYKNGILQIVFGLVDEKPTGTKVEVE